jgi:hypothetical protein
MYIHIITLKKQKCQDAKMSRLQDLFFFQYTKVSGFEINRQIFCRFKRETIKIGSDVPPA